MRTTPWSIVLVQNYSPQVNITQLEIILPTISFTPYQKSVTQKV
jgi:hypothetical protein